MVKHFPVCSVCEAFLVVLPARIHISFFSRFLESDPSDMCKWLSHAWVTSETGSGKKNQNSQLLLEKQLFWNVCSRFQNSTCYLVFVFAVTVILNLWFPLNVRHVACIFALWKVQFQLSDHIPICNFNQPNGTGRKLLAFEKYTTVCEPLFHTEWKRGTVSHPGEQMY